MPLERASRCAVPLRRLCRSPPPHPTPPHAQALAEAAETESAGESASKKKTAHTREDAGVNRAASSSLRLRQLYCLSHCLLGRLVEWTDASEAMKHYESAVRVLPCSESFFQHGRLALKTATSHRQLEAAQQVSV